MNFVERFKKTALALIVLLLVLNGGSISFGQENGEPKREMERSHISDEVRCPEHRIHPAYLKGSECMTAGECYQNCSASGLEIAFCMKACGLGMMEEP